MKLYGSDLNLQQSYFNEAAAVLGTDVFYHAVESADFNNYQDRNITYKPKKQVSIILEQHPKVATLKMFGWYKENKGENPIIAFFPITLEDLTRWAKIEFESHVGVTLRSFEISEIAQQLVYPSYWICKMAPIMFDTTDDPSYLPVEGTSDGKFKRSC